MPGAGPRRKLTTRRKQRQRKGQVERDARFGHVAGSETHATKTKWCESPSVHNPEYRPSTLDQALFDSPNHHAAASFPPMTSHRKEPEAVSMARPTVDQIVHGDCLGLLRSMPDESVDLVVSSPPYNLGKEYESKRALAIYLDEQKEVLSECARVLKPTGSIVWQVGAFSDDGILIPLDIRFFPILESLGLKPRNRIMWVRQHGLHARNKFSCRHETLLWFTKSDEYVFRLDDVRVPQKYPEKTAWKGPKKGQLTGNPGGKNPGDIWLFRNVKHNHEEQTIHPCQFPEDMIARIVLSLTEPGAIVFDPYMGAGTVAVVAKDTGRHFLGAELDERYHSVAMRRIKGEPDESGCFPNLRTLRQYAARTGERPEKYRFDVQVGTKATAATQSRIKSELEHQAELESRLDSEEAAFSERALNRPVAEGLALKQVRRKRAPATKSQPALFESDQSD
jgi:adenine-specific DNA-methyltransferase